MHWATATNVLRTLLNWEGKDIVPVTLSQIRSASEELLEAMGDLQDDIKELTLNFQERDKQLTDATATIKRLQDRPMGQATIGQAYHQSQYEARRATGVCTTCGGIGHFHATCPQRNPLTPIESPTTTESKSSVPQPPPSTRFRPGSGQP